MAIFVHAPRDLVMDDVTWEMYDHFLQDFGHGGTRVVYDNGMMEIMTVGSDHECVKTAAARLLEFWAVEKDWPVNGYGNVTLRRKDLRVGLEPDECYYIITPPPTSSRGELDLSIYPPPDLAIEIEITRSSIGKTSIYARIGVPEIFRWTGDRFIVLERLPDGDYAERDRSRFLPDLSVDELSELTRLAIQTDQPTALKALRDRLRSR